MKKWLVLLCALLFAGCSHSQSAAPQADEGSARGTAPAAPVDLTYRVGTAADGQTRTIDIDINTPLKGGTLLVEVAKQVGVDVPGATTQRIDLATAARPITLHLQALPLGSGAHFLVLLLTVDTPIGQMSRSFRIDLATPAAGATL